MLYDCSMAGVGGHNTRSVILVTLLALALISCSRQADVPNKDVANKNVANENTPPGAPQKLEGGTIEATSTPVGASVMLIETGEGGVGPPKPRGSTPTSISGLLPGKYVVHIEKPGYTFFQKKVEIKGNESVKVDARLKKN